MNNIMTILKKEFLVFVRDRRSLFMIMVVPLVFYPLMFSVIGKFASKNREELRTSQFKVYVDPSVSPDLEKFVSAESNIQVLRETKADPIELLNDDKIQAVVTMKDQLLIQYLSSDRKSREAATRMRLAALDYRESIIVDQLRAAGVDEAVLHPFDVERQDVASAAKVSGRFLGRILPYMIIIMLFSGAMGFGLETSTGEKEKGTIATLLVSQASRSQIVLGKLLYVVAIEVLYGLLNVAGFVLAAGLQAKSFDPQLAQQAAQQAGTASNSFAFAVMPQTFLLLVVLVIPIALIAAALIIAIGSYAKSMKEGQTFFTPFLMVFILVGILSMTAPLKVPEYYFWIPVVNTSFAMQELLTLKFQMGHFLSTILTTTGMAALLIGLTVWMFNRESIHFRS